MSSVVPVVVVSVLALFWVMKSIVTGIHAVVRVVDTLASWASGEQPSSD